MKSSGTSHKEVRGKREELGSSLNTYQGYDTQMLLIYRLSYGPALTRNTEERAYVCPPANFKNVWVQTFDRARAYTTFKNKTLSHISATTVSDSRVY